MEGWMEQRWEEEEDEYEDEDEEEEFLSMKNMRTCLNMAHEVSWSDKNNAKQ